MFFKTKEQEIAEYDKRLYDSDIIQELYETINDLEDRIKVLEAFLVLKGKDDNTDLPTGK